MTQLEHERRRRGWNQTVLAYHAQITQSEVSLIERRRLVPTPLYARRLARALKIAPEALLIEVGDVTRESSAPQFEPTPIAV